jgi:putative transposase
MFPRNCSHYRYKLIEGNGDPDHIHLLIECPPTGSPSSVVGRLQHISAKFFLKPYGAQCWGHHKHTLWNSGYFVASTGRVTLETLKKYVENQGRS